MRGLPGRRAPGLLRLSRYGVQAAGRRLSVRVRRSGSGQRELRVFVDQSYDPEWPATAANVHYDFDSSLTPVRAELADNYVATHRRLEAAGLLDHARTDGDARRAWPVLAWRSSTQTWAALP